MAGTTVEAGLTPLPIGGGDSLGDLLECRVERSPDAAWVFLRGEVCLASASLLREYLLHVLEQPQDIIVLTSEVRYIDMAGIHVLEEVERRALDARTRVILASPSPVVKRVFSLVGINGRLPIAPTKAAALAYLLRRQDT